VDHAWAAMDGDLGNLLRGLGRGAAAHRAAPGRCTVEARG
jgi:hypothetical protein